MLIRYKRLEVRNDVVIMLAELDYSVSQLSAIFVKGTSSPSSFITPL